ncbi:MAG: hypothetical protein J5965_25890 [Aeriscardovia sp.]|nr:hypothetical protein [Aeriscardovia sp.]
MKSNKKERKSGFVRVRGGFSDTSGIAPRNKTIQLDEFDDDTRTRISNKLYELLAVVFEHTEDFYYSYRFEDAANSFCKDLINDVFCQRNALRSGYSYDWQKVFESIHEVIEQATFNEVLDIVEYTCRWLDSSIKQHKGFMFPVFNHLFEQEYVGYRFVNGRIVAISDTTEIDAIEEACCNPVEGCRTQLQKALDFLADRENRDYKNSIKESISAVESICQVIVNNEKATLGEALKQLESQGLAIHPSLKQAFLKLYGYTSDQGGIRHAEGMFESDVTFEEAKFMLVSCSAFINYLISEIGKGGN